MQRNDKPTPATPTAQEADPMMTDEEISEFIADYGRPEDTFRYLTPPQPSETVAEAQIDAIAMALSRRIFKQTEGEWQPNIRQADELARAALRALKGKSDA